MTRSTFRRPLASAPGSALRRARVAADAAEAATPGVAVDLDLMPSKDLLVGLAYGGHREVVALPREASAKAMTRRLVVAAARVKARVIRSESRATPRPSMTK